jgi:uncharacterized DUF497 family protein
VGGRAVGGGFSSHESPHEQPDAQGASKQRFEYDLAKSASNKEKHGIDFEEAKALWNDDTRNMAPVPYATEARYLVTGLIDKKHWTAVVTERNGNIRLISVRRAREKEVEHYEQNNN